MHNETIVVERSFAVPASKLWTALTDKEEMKAWYFNLAEFKAEPGFKFQFTGGPDGGIQYLHLCEVTEAIPGKKLTYSWRYDGYEGISYVSFELFEQDGSTLLRLTHSGIGSFPESNPDLAISNFKEGWNAIINTSLKNYLEQQSPVISTTGEIYFN